MKKGETLFQRVVFKFVYLLAMAFPPFASVKRLEPVCRSWLDKNLHAYTPRKGLAVAYKVGEKYRQAKTEYTYMNQLGYLTDKDVVNFSEVLYKLEEYQEVVELLLPMSKKYPKGERTNRHLGWSYMKLGMCNKAIVYLEHLAKLRVPTYED
ncbi:MAG: tetratricopeptide repeat protein, partial [Bacteroidia bacterium]